MLSNFIKKDIDNALRVVQLKLKLGMIGSKRKKFNMANGYQESCISQGEDEHYCHTVGCIAGYAEKEMGITSYKLLNKINDNEDGYQKNDRRLHKLFFPTGYGKGEEDIWDNLTPKHAVKAIDNYFKGKADPWNGVVKRNTKMKYLEGVHF